MFDSTLNTYASDYSTVIISIKLCHYLKSVRIRSFSGPYFPAFGLDTDRYSVSLHNQSDSGKIRTRKTPNIDTFYAMRLIALIKSLSLLPIRQECIYVSSKRKNILLKMININPSKFVNSLKMEYLRCYMQLIYNRKSNNLK